MGKRKKVIPDEGTWKLQKIRVDLHRALPRSKDLFRQRARVVSTRGIPGGLCQPALLALALPKDVSHQVLLNSS